MLGRIPAGGGSTFVDAPCRAARKSVCSEAKPMTLLSRRMSLTAALLTCLSVATTAAPGFKVIANTSVPTHTLSRDSVAQIFTRKNVKWPDGSRVVPVDLPVGSRTRESFSQAVHGKGSAVVDAYWQKQLFSGRDLPPLTKASDAEMLSYVRVTSGAIGYISSETDAGGVKVIVVE
jgi:ABC-type phosphate transport system substrate-binding protein